MDKKYKPDNTLVEALYNINALLNKKQKKRGIVILLLLFINAFLDVIGLGMIYPLIDATINPNLIQERFYFKYLYNSFQIEQPIAFILILSWFVLFILIIKNVVSLVIIYIQTKYTFSIALSLNERMLRYYYEQGFLFLKNQTSGEKLFNIKNAPEYFAENYFMRVLLAITEIVVILLICLGLLFYQPQILFLLTFVVCPFFLAFFKFTKSRVEQKGELIASTYVKSQNILLENIDAYIDVLLTNTEKKFLGKFLVHQKDLFQSRAIVNIYNITPRKMYDIVLISGIITILIIAWLSGNNTASIISTLSIFALCAYRLIPAISATVSHLVEIKNLTPRIRPILVLCGYLSSEFKDVQALDLKKSIDFQKISFTFPDSPDIPVLKNISFTVKKGEKIGFIGASGSGKTTLLNILLRLLIENNGQIKVDNKPLVGARNAAFQKNIGYVQQEVFIKNGSLKENIAFGENLEDISLDRLNQAVKNAMLFEFIKNHPQGLDMPLGENGVKLSGGQKQRVGIARALYKQAQVLIFDEPTSALDMETESAIVETIHQLAKTDKTIFIVAHRITTLNSCDRIYELKDGQIDRMVTYKTLFEEKMSIREFGQNNLPKLN